MLQDVPTTLGRRYQVEERLGRGGMADVFRAKDLILGRVVAIKVFRGGVEREDHLARFRTEVRTLAALTHPHLVALYDAGGDVNEPWCVMEYLRGGSLADRKGASTPVQVATLGEQIGTSLSYVHDRGIVHRDVKPSNVLLDDDGMAYLSDFGIARLIDGTRMTQSGLMIGTAAFLSPEQVRGESAGPAADVYALGLVLLEMLTGRREYPGTPVESAVSRLSRQPRVPAEFEPLWGDLLRRMTALAPEDRPGAEEIAEELYRISRLSATLLAAGASAPGQDDAADGATSPADQDGVLIAAIPGPRRTPTGGSSTGDDSSTTAEQPRRRIRGWAAGDRRRQLVLGAAGAAMILVTTATGMTLGRIGMMPALHLPLAPTGSTTVDPTTATGVPGVVDQPIEARQAPVQPRQVPEFGGARGTQGLTGSPVAAVTSTASPSSSSPTPTGSPTPSASGSVSPSPHGTSPTPSATAP